MIDGPRVEPTPDKFRDGAHSGIGGLGHGLAEIRLCRPWTQDESDLAATVVTRLRRRIPQLDDVSSFDGLSSTIGVLIALDETGADTAVRRLLVTMDSDGWPTRPLPPRVYRPGARLNDAAEGTASALLAAVFAIRHDVPGAPELAHRAADVLIAASERETTGLNWRYVSPRFTREPSEEMPNWSHGLAGIAAPLALTGVELDRADLVEAARQGAEHLVTLADTSRHGCMVPLSVPVPTPRRSTPSPSAGATGRPVRRCSSWPSTGPVSPRWAGGRP